jgi:RHS repeat-associated protein
MVQAHGLEAEECTEYVYDRESGQPLLVDDGTNAYLHGDGVLAAIDGADDPSYLLADALGSVRGVTDDAGDLVGSANFAVYGEARAASGVSTLFRYTGEQHDAETGFTYLRARYLNPALGRFTSADTVQPNAPGTQGYNLYAYVAGNPTTWVDPSGHLATDLGSIAYNWVTSPRILPLVMASLLFDDTRGVTGAGLMILLGQVASKPTKPFPYPKPGVPATPDGPTIPTNPGTPDGSPRPLISPLRAAFGLLFVASGVLACVMLGPCADVARRIGDVLPRGSDGPVDDPLPNPKTHPEPPASPRPLRTCQQMGRFAPETAHMSWRAWAYQFTVSLSHSELPGMKYVAGGRSFDGCKDGVLMEAKGCGNDRVWTHMEGAREKLDRQLMGQSRAAQIRGASHVDWYAAEEGGRDWILERARSGGLSNINAFYFPAFPPCD